MGRERARGAGADEERAPADIVSTWVEVTFRPGRFFARPAGERSTVGPVLFAIVVSTAGGVGGAIVESMVGSGQGDGVSAALRALIGAPIQTAIGLVVTAGLLHLLLKMFGGAKAKGAGAAEEGGAGERKDGEENGGKRGGKKGKKGVGDRVFEPPAEVARGNADKGGGPGPFSETMACVGYAYAPALFGVLGFPGAGVGGIWWLVILSVGLSRVHRTSGPKVVAAAFGILAFPVLLALGLRAGIVEAFKIPSGGMLPTLAVGDHLFVSKMAYGPKVPWTEARLWKDLPPRRGDVVVFQFPENRAQDFVKRAIAVPGDTLEVIDGRPILNGWLVPHCLVGKTKYEGRAASMYVEYLGELSYLTMFEVPPEDRQCKEAEACGGGAVCKAGVCGSVLQGPFRVAEGEVWVMGDNRNNSHDSRSWRGGRGAGVPFDHIKGRAAMVWMSLSPGGGVARERLFLDVMGRPELPPGSDPGLRKGLEGCLSNRPPVAETTPPAR